MISRQMWSSNLAVEHRKLGSSKGAEWLRWLRDSTSENIEHEQDVTDFFSISHKKRLIPHIPSRKGHLKGKGHLKKRKHLSWL